MRNGGERWQPMQDGQEDEVLRGSLEVMAQGSHVTPLTADQLRDAVEPMPGRKAAGLDHWAVQQLKGQPQEA